MIVDRNTGYIFVSVPKTASISIQFSLGFGNDIPEPHLYHQSIASILSKDSSIHEYFKFAFVRNPWDRILSLYKDFTVKRVYQYSALVKHDKPLFGEFKDFNDFCVNVKNSPWMNDIFLTSQVDLLSVNGVDAMDFTGRFENLQNDFNRVCSMLQLKATLLKYNVGEYDHTSYRQYYNDEARKAIESLYAADIERYQYEF